MTDKPENERGELVNLAKEIAARVSAVSHTRQDIREQIILDALSAQQAGEPETANDGPCVENDGCPTESAVLQRFWREHKTAPTSCVREGMLPVMQTAFGEGNGNCYSACLASLLALPITQVPNFYSIAGTNPDEWWKAVRNWLRTRGYGVLHYDGITDIQWLSMVEGNVIVSGKSKRGLDHSTIWREGKMVHDPHPDGTGIEAPYCLDLIYPLFTRAAEQINAED